jgi:hypothetical protein
VRAALGWLLCLPRLRSVVDNRSLRRNIHPAVPYLAPFLVEAGHSVSTFGCSCATAFWRCCWRAPFLVRGRLASTLGLDGPSSRNVGLSRLRRRLALAIFSCWRSDVFIVRLWLCDGGGRAGAARPPPPPDPPIHPPPPPHTHTHTHIGPTYSTSRLPRRYMRYTQVCCLLLAALRR